jgi:hypothetical protein
LRPKIDGITQPTIWRCPVCRRPCRSRYELKVHACAERAAEARGID